MGKAEGKIELIGLLLANQVGAISPEITEKIKKLSIEQMNQLALNLRGFASTDDLTSWLKQHSSSDT